MKYIFLYQIKNLDVQMVSRDRHFRDCTVLHWKFFRDYSFFFPMIFLPIFQPFSIFNILFICGILNCNIFTFRKNFRHKTIKFTLLNSPFRQISFYSDLHLPLHYGLYKFLLKIFIKIRKIFFAQDLIKYENMNV